VRQYSEPSILHIGGSGGIGKIFLHRPDSPQQPHVISSLLILEDFRVSAAFSLGDFDWIPSVKGSQRYGKKRQTPQRERVSRNISVLSYLCISIIP